MPKLNLRTARRIKAASGEVLRLKGQGFEWTRPAPLTDQVIEALGPSLLAMWDFTDPASLYQDAAGTVPALSLGDPIGRVLDKSGNGNPLTQATTPARPLRSVRGAEFDGVDDGLAETAASGLVGAGCSLFAGVTFDSVVGQHSVAATNGLRVTSIGSGLRLTVTGVADITDTGYGLSAAAFARAGMMFGGDLTVTFVKDGVKRPAMTAPGGVSIQPTLLAVGYRVPQNDHRLDGAIRRMLSVDRTLTDPEIVLVDAWLKEGVQ